MVAGGSPIQKRAVVTISIAGVAVAFGFGVARCMPPDGPTYPQPDPVVDAAWPAPELDGTAGDTAPEQVAPLPACDFKVPRARSRTRPPRIVGGNAATEGEYPYAVSVSDGDWHYCGASVVAERWILSAAHCQIQPGDVARVGAANRLKARQIRIVESRIHRSYDAETLKWDVAVARLESPAGVPAVRLGREVLPTSAIVVGYGRTSEGGPVTNQLLEVTVPIVPRDVCNQAYGDVDGTQVCADGAGIGACQGDSGGPLLQLAPEGLVQIGIVSFGVGCARPPPFVGVYTNTTHQAIARWVESCTSSP